VLAFTYDAVLQQLTFKQVQYLWAFLPFTFISSKFRRFHFHFHDAGRWSLNSPAIVCPTLPAEIKTNRNIVTSCGLTLMLIMQTLFIVSLDL
jgi:hypothetical protein